MRVRVGMVGLGKMGLSHCAILNAHPDVELVGVCDSNGFVRRGLAKYSGLPTFKDYKSLVHDSGLEGLLIATPTSSHFEIIQHAMHRGVHVFCEKPLCLTAEESKALVRLATERELIGQVGYHNRFVGTFKEARRLVSAGAIGEVYHYTAQAFGPVVLRSKAGTWRSKSSEGGGCIRDYASHVLDLVNFLVGPPEHVSGTAMKSIYSQQVEDAVFATLWHENGVTGQLSVNWSDEAFRKMTTRMEVFGVGGKIYADRQECRTYIKGKDGFEDLPHGWNIRYTTELTDPVSYYLRGEEYSAQIDHFVALLKGGKENISSFESATQTDEVIELLVEDARRRNGRGSHSLR